MMDMPQENRRKALLGMDMVDERNVSIPESIVSNQKLLDKDLLLYSTSSTWERIQKEIILLKEVNLLSNYDNEFDENESDENIYINFINAIKQCCNQKQYISSSEYESLLKWLLYINVYATFDSMRNGLLVKQINQIEEQNNIEEENISVLLDYLLNDELNNYETISDLCRENNIYRKNEIHKEIYNDDYYSNQLTIINQIINNLIKIMIDNHPTETKDSLKSEILSIITQGIYDSAYCRKKDKKYEKPSMNYSKIFTEKSAIDKIDREFDVTNTIDDIYSNKKQNYGCFNFFGLFNCGK